MSPAWVREMTRPRSELPAQRKRYGLGFRLHASTGLVLLEGMDAGVSFLSAHDPGPDTTATVLSSTTRGARPIARAFGSFLADRVLPVRSSPSASRLVGGGRWYGAGVALALTIVPANQASCEDLRAVLGTRGAGARCQCQRYKLARGEAFEHFPAEERAHRLRMQTECGNPESETTSGLVSYLEGEPMGWCAVEPRTHYSGLLRVYRVPWEGRDEDKADGSVWAVTCVFVRAGFRGRGASYALVRATVAHARERGARALEGYPMRTEPGRNVIWDEIHVGTQKMFEAAGFSEVARPSKRRIVMRIDF